MSRPTQTGVDTSVSQTPAEVERANTIRRHSLSLVVPQGDLMMRLCKLALAVGALALVASPVLAQRGGFGFGGGGAQLLNNKSVQDELKMDKEQVEKVKDALDKVRKDHEEDLAKLRPDSGASQEERAEVFKKLNEANQKAVAGILKAEQEKRFKQIQHQMQGVGLFQDPEAQKSLKLTDKQKEEIKTIAEDMQKEMRDLFSGGFTPETRQKIQALRKDALDKAKKVLDDDQRKTYQEMTGKPFEIKFEPPRGRGGA
jgi:Spy/CpxP family protein refolding chaperone